jgi:hypothetical protein
MDFVDLIVAVHDHLDAAGLPHAFGGALALGYVATPRGTVDIDVNVFVAPTSLDRIVDALAPLRYRLGDPEEAGEEGDGFGGVRLLHEVEPFPLDVFPSLDDRYRDVEARVVRHPFGRAGAILPFLSAEDLCAFKLSFGRPQDWVDLQAVAAARPDLDIEYLEELVVALRGPTMYPRVARLRGFLRRP